MYFILAMSKSISAMLSPTDASTAAIVAYFIFNLYFCSSSSALASAYNTSNLEYASVFMVNL